MSKKLQILFLTQEEVIAAGGMDMKATVEAVEHAFALEVKGECIEPEPPMILFGDQAGRRFTMHPCYLGGDVNAAGIKWAGSNPANPKRLGLPRALAMFVLNDPETTYPQAIMESTVISGMRTGAVAGLAAKYLARKGSEVAGILGAGVIARYQAMAFRETMPDLKLIKVFDVVSEKAEAWAREMSDRLGVQVKTVGSAEECVRDSDVASGATTVACKDRYVRNEWLKEGGLFCNISDNDPTFELVRGCDKIIVDGYRQFHVPVVMGEMVRQGLLKESDVWATMGQVVAGMKLGRESDRERIMFSALGLGMEDLVNVKRVVENAKRLGLGKVLDLWENPIFV